MGYIKDVIQSGNLSKDLFGGCRMKTFSDFENKASVSLVTTIRRFCKIKKKNTFGNRGKKLMILWSAFLLR